MSSTESYQGIPRTDLGSRAASRLRAGGKVPVTISRSGQPSHHVSIEEKSARHLDAHVVHLCKLQVEGKTYTALRAEVVKDVLSDKITHIDLQEVDEKSTIKVDVAVHVDARNCPGVKAGGIVEQRLRKIRVRCPANAIPDQVEVDLGDVQLTETIFVERCKLPKGVTLVTPAKNPLLSVVIPRGMKKGEEEDAAKAAEAAAGPQAATAAAPAAADGDKKAGDKDKKADAPKKK